MMLNSHLQQYATNATGKQIAYACRSSNDCVLWLHATTKDLAESNLKNISRSDAATTAYNNPWNGGSFVSLSSRCGRCDALPAGVPSGTQAGARNASDLS
jgi:hypothetical protein